MQYCYQSCYVIWKSEESLCFHNWKIENKNLNLIFMFWRSVLSDVYFKLLYAAKFFPWVFHLLDDFLFSLCFYTHLMFRLNVIIINRTINITVQYLILKYLFGVWIFISESGLVFLTSADKGIFRLSQEVSPLPPSAMRKCKLFVHI